MSDEIDLRRRSFVTVTAMTLAASSFGVSAIAHAQSADTPTPSIAREELKMPRQVVSLTLEDARRIIAAGERQANELKIPYNIAVVDAGGGLIAHVRMDGA